MCRCPECLRKEIKHEIYASKKREIPLLIEPQDSIEVRDVLARWSLQDYRKYCDYEICDFDTKPPLDKDSYIKFIRAVQYSLVEENKKMSNLVSETLL